MDGHWDVIVVGAGLGGLTAAAKLVNNGRRVLVIDQNDVAGGTANVYGCGPFTFPMGPLGFANPDMVSRALQEIGLDSPAFERIDYRLLAFGKDLVLSQPPASIAKELTAAYPEDAKGVRGFFQIIQDRAPSYQEWIDAGAKEPLHSSSANAVDYLNDNISDQGLRHILGSIGTTAPCSDLDLLTAMWIMITGKGICYPRGGMKHLCTALCRRIQSDGAGRVELGCRVKLIEVRARRVRGVVLEGGSEVSAESVISNADFKNTFLHLVSRNELPDHLYNDVSRAPQTTSRIQVCLGLRSSSLDLSVFDGASRLIYRKDGGLTPGQREIDWRAGEIEPGELAGQELEITLLSRDDALVAPPDGATMIIRVAADYGHFAKYKTGHHGRGPGYLEYKTGLADALVAEVGELVPGLADSIEVIDIATPLTFEEFGGRSEGTIAGWSWNHPANDSSVRRLVLTPVSRLYMAGYQAFSRMSLGGIPSAILSGLEAARYVIEEAGPVEELAIPLGER